MKLSRVKSFYKLLYKIINTKLTNLSLNKLIIKNLQWRRDFFEWELALVNNLMQDLSFAKLNCKEKDAWHWIPDRDDGAIR